MEQIKKFRTDEARRLLNWIRHNREDWIGVCQALNEEDVLIDKEYKEVIEVLSDNGFYEIIIALLYSRNTLIQRAMEDTLLMNLEQNWSVELVDKLLGQIKTNIKKAILAGEPPIS